MFLNKLTKAEGEKFLEICYIIANTDGEFHESEQSLLTSYAEEMKLYNYKIQEKNNIDELILFFSDKTEEVKKIVFFELLGMALIDGKYLNREIALINRIQDELNIDEILSEKIKKWMYERVLPWLKEAHDLNREGESILDVKIN